MASLHWADYVVCILCLAISLGIGVFQGLIRRQKTTKEFIMAGRKLAVLPTALSFVVSFISAIAIIGYAAEMYNFGIQQWPLVLMAYATSAVIVERIIVGWIYPLQITSIYEYLERRFDSRLMRTVGAIIGIIWQNLYMGTALFAPAIAFEAATGFSFSLSIPIMAFVCTCYTAAGGMRAVIWTDVFQFIVMLSGVLCVTVAGVLGVGSFPEVFEIANKYDRITPISFSPDPRIRQTFWTYLIGFTWNWVYWSGLSQPAVQRYCALPTLRKSKLVILLGLGLVLPLLSLTFLNGIIMVAYFGKVQCDPLADGQITNPNQMIISMAGYLYEKVPGIQGLFFAALFSGGLSSVSSSLSGSAANMWEDVFKNKLQNRLTDVHASWFNKLLVVIFGCTATTIAFVVSYVPGPTTEVSTTLMGAVGGPMTGLYILGGAFTFTNWLGGLVGLAAGLAVNIWIGFGALMYGTQQSKLPALPTDGCYNFTQGHLNNGENGFFDVTRPSVWENTTAYAHKYSSFPTWQNGTTSVIDATVNASSSLSDLYQISYLWYSPIGSTVTLIVGLVTSFIANAAGLKTKEVPKELLISFRSVLDFTCKQDNEDDVTDIKPESQPLQQHTDPSRNGKEKTHSDKLMTSC